jgi:hypothetical protein
MLYVRFDLPSDEPVQFVGCYTTRWGRVDEPTVAFREATPEEIYAAGYCPIDTVTAAVLKINSPLD